MLQRLTAHFSGSVQGVGFRYTAERLAVCFPVTGFVRNLSDGRVELVAEGEKKTLKEFLTAIRQSPLAEGIHQLETRWDAAEGSFKGFGIRY